MDWLLREKAVHSFLLLPVTEGSQTRTRRFGPRAADRLIGPFNILSKK
jgi:hypothetical protein